MPQPNIGIIGAGMIAGHHADALDALGRSIHAVADLDPTALQTFADKYGVEQTYASHESMLADTDVDAVVVAVPNAFHAECTIDALEADASVLVEKPLATSYDAAAEIATAERESRGTVMVGFCKTFNPWFEWLDQRVADGRFGSVYDVEAEFVRRRGIPRLGSWFTQKEIAGGGAMIDIGVHVLHQVLTLLEFPEIQSVSAATGRNFGTKDGYTYLDMWGGDPEDDATFDVDDHTRAMIHTDSGATVNLHVAWASNSEKRQILRVHGDEAGATVRVGDGGTTVYSTDGDALSTTKLDHKSVNPITRQWEYFLEVLRGEREHTRNTLEEGLAVQQAIERIYDSANQHQERKVES